MSNTDGARTGTTLGPYSIGRLLGRGGMGEVYRAHDERRDRDVALKVLHSSVAEDEAFRARFDRESHAAAGLADPHVIPIHDFGEIDGVLYIDMRLVEGRDLADVLRDGPLDAAEAVDVVAQVAGALDAAHAKGLVHRDVKPANIRLTASGFPYLVDFGLAVADSQSRMTSAGMFVGSQAYAAPERFDGTTPTAAGDEYALTCVLFEALTGRPPFHADSLGAMLRLHATAEIPRVSDTAAVPTAMDGVIERGMAKEPGDRYGSCGELSAAARAALDGASAPTVRLPDPGTGYDETVIRPAVAAGGETGASRSVDAPTHVSQPGLPPAASYPAASYPGVSHPGGYRGASYPRAEGSYPQAGYPGALGHPYPAPAPRRGIAVPVLATAALALVAIVGVLAYVLLGNRDSRPETTAAGGSAAAPPTATQTATQTVTAQGQATTVIAAPPTQTGTSAAPAVTVADLQARAAGDRPYVLASLNNRWVAQLSTKQPGWNVDGKVWDAAAILDEENSLSQRYGGARLLYSTDWTVFDMQDAWVTVTAFSFPDPDSAVNWCKTSGFDNEHCLAKFISDTAGPSGTTRTF
ncbi:serine/threonine-protein kinase [Tsukamurella sp. 8F]|uniref:serine/threonine-protein kinase n=1 Tax=unclassified Tsukamurella TaxID=2633480 RepID=UPI0023B99C8C|nr:MULTISPECIES: serine/threonine-protein kinase [unclassified Tsukamurella]MDF0528551.1 serine/threonine-protein kinase [Tsukamurella sp. 8J]MDF0585513.1 serine/threonine-protein kinase [Tsukamurella sp. 8F]